jgi:hypothetical protein
LATRSNTACIYICLEADCVEFEDSRELEELEEVKGVDVEVYVVKSVSRIVLMIVDGLSPG